MIRTLFPAFWVGLLLLGASGLGQAQDAEIPDALRDKALSISIRATVSRGEDNASWESLGIRNTVPGSPVGIKLVGSNVVIVFQLTPFENGKNSVNLVTQGQVWVKKENGEINYRTTLDSMSILYGERVYYFPLGQDVHGSSPLRVEILVEPYNSEAGKALRVMQLQEKQAPSTVPARTGTTQGTPPAVGPPPSESPAQDKSFPDPKATSEGGPKK